MSESEPFSALTTMADRSLALSGELPSRDNARIHWTGLGFSLLGQQFVVPMDEVVETMRIPQTTRLPGVKSFVVGVGNIRGRLMAILDLAEFFGSTSEISRNQRRVLVVEDEEQYFGFIVDESLGMQHFPSDAFEQSVDEIDEIFQPFVRGGYRVSASHWPVFSFTALAEHPELEKLAVAT